MEYWKVGNSVESHSHPHKVPGGTRINKRKFDEFIAGLPMPEPAEHLEDRIALLEAKVKHLMEVTLD